MRFPRRLGSPGAVLLLSVSLRLRVVATGDHNGVGQTLADHAGLDHAVPSRAGLGWAEPSRPGWAKLSWAVPGWAGPDWGRLECIVCLLSDMRLRRSGQLTTALRAAR